ncbi:hypothetical protein ACQPYK_23420 [Streptosporangium sp. CA-135522]|uniref:hypothetical protein n=1 Tax=Streptosporangium sp. CA-135522 TaxID=3240072 RepID=UPI003D92CB3E
MTDRARLALGRPLGHDGQGMVHEELNGKINGQWDVAYKEFDPEVLSHLDLAVLTAMTQLIGRLSPSDAAWLVEKTTWPAELVETNGAVTGFLMRTVPQRFFFDVRTPSGTVRQLATMDLLFDQESVTDRDRLLILADLADTLARLHAMGIVVGELSPKNVLFTTGPQPECFLIGCDAMRLGGAQALPPVETPPGWQVPAGEQQGTPQSDAYKFALLAIRVFARDPSSTDVSRLAAISPGLTDFAMAALRQPSFNRPLPPQWAVRLRETAQSGPTLPPVHHAQPSRDSGRSKKIGISAAAGAVALVLLVVGVKAVVKNTVRGSLAGPSKATTEPAETSSPDPTPTDTPTQTPTEEPAEEPFDIDDLNREDSDPTPITTEGLLPSSFTSDKGVHFTFRGGAVEKCPSPWPDAHVKSALRKAGCNKMAVGTYVNMGAPAGRRILVSVWVVPLKNVDRAESAYSRLKNYSVEDWGIRCPLEGPGSSGICFHPENWLNAQLYGWTGYRARYVIHTIAVYTNRASSPSVKPWVKDASKAASNAVGPGIYDGAD